MTVPFINTSATEQNIGRTGDYDETKKLLGVRKPYCTNVNSSQNICAEPVCKRIGANFLPPTDFHIVKRTALHSMILLCIVGTAMTVSVINTSATDYHSGRTVDYDETKILLLDCKPYHTDADPRQKICAKVFPKIFEPNVLL